jgi:hypothetical protein
MKTTIIPNHTAVEVIEVETFWEEGNPEPSVAVRRYPVVAWEVVEDDHDIRVQPIIPPGLPTRLDWACVYPNGRVDVGDGSLISVDVFVEEMVKNAKAKRQRLTLVPSEADES